MSILEPTHKLQHQAQQQHVKQRKKRISIMKEKHIGTKLIEN
jgi:hypothetical protein